MTDGTRPAIPAATDGAAARGPDSDVADKEATVAYARRLLPLT